MDITLKKEIVAIVTLDPKSIISSGIPVFLAKDNEQLERISLLISRVTNTVAHDLENGVWILVRH